MANENVTVLFTDMVGSTALATSLAPDAGDALRREHFAILRQAIAESGGTEVKNLGDGVMVVFGAASAALACAVGMQQGVERDNRRREQSIGLRVGLSIGEVTREDDDYFGDPVVEAARLCASCDGGQILATDVVRLMAGRRSRHECRAMGELTLKGLPDPVEAVEVVWEPVDLTASRVEIPIPGRLAGRPTFGVVGRDTEIATIADAYKRVANGHGREVLLVSGEAGLGKTTLVAEAARDAFDDGACVLFGHCEEDLATPYQLFTEAIGHYVIHAPENELVAHGAAHGSELARLVPALSSRVPDLPPSRATDADSDRFLLFAAVVGLLASASQRQPVVVVLDDLQWADGASLQLLRHLSASDLPMRVLILGTYRDSELSHAHALVETVAALHRQSGISRIELAGLDDTGVLAFLESAAGHAMEDDGVVLAHALYRETDGNPLFVGEVLRHLAESGAIYQDADGRWVAKASLEQMTLPVSVREVIGGRVVRLGSDAGRVLSMAAVIGRDFDLDLLAKATNTSQDELLDILDAAAGAALVRELAGAAGHYSFSHALIQHTLYEDLGPTRRARAHRQVAEALEDLCGDRPGARVGELARHWTNATQAIDLGKAIDYSRQAGDGALAALAPVDALRYYARALDLYAQATEPDLVLGIDLAIGLGIAQNMTGDPAFREVLLDAARRAADLGLTDRLVTAALANSTGAFSDAGVIDADKVEILELALERVSAGDPKRALVLGGLCAELSYWTPLERRVALADEALALAEASGDDAILVRVINAVSIPLQVPPLLERSLAQTGDALVRAERTGDPVLLFWAAQLRVEAAAHVGDIDEMDRCLAIGAALAGQLEQPTMRWLNTYTRALRALMVGDPDVAEQLAVEAFEFGSSFAVGTPTAVFSGQLVAVSDERGVLGDLAAAIEEAVENNPGLPVFIGVLASAYAQGGRCDDARRLLAEFAATGYELPLDQLWTTGMVTYATAAIECSDPEHAGALFDALAPYADQWATAGGSTPQGPISLVLGGLATLLGHYDAAQRHLEHSAAECNRTGAKFFAARTDLLRGGMHAVRNAPGDRERARGFLGSARTVAAANGYAYIERRATEALDRLS